jgi:hypothetical protein
MFSKPLAFVLLALGCLTAAAGGAYFATRHNVADTTAVALAPASTPAAAGQPARPQAVAETEAAVSAPKADAKAVPDSKTPAEAAQAEAPIASSSRPPAPVREPAAKARPQVQPTKPSAAPATVTRTPQRTVPMNGAATPAQNEPAGAPQAAPASSAAPTAPKPVDTPKPIEEPQPEPARVPQFEEVILPAASVIGLQVETSMSTERARVEDRVDARVSRDVMAAGRIAIPAGSRVIGSVTTVERGGKVKEQARLGIRFHTLVLADGSQVPLHMDPIYRLGEQPSASSSKKIGGAAVGGAILGAILGGGKGAAAGGAIGAGAGTAAVMAGDRSAATLRQGEYLNAKLASPATITVERRE